MGYYGAINQKGRVIMSYNVKSVDSLRKAVCQSLSDNGFTFSISERDDESSIVSLPSLL